MAKKRILLVGESGWTLNTGFSTIHKELITRLIATNKYEIAELASYVNPGDPKLLDAPWKVYTAVPEDNNKIAQSRYNSSIYGQFGEAVFEQVCLQFMPDYVFSVVDSWMLHEWIRNSPYLKYFKLISMPTVDGFPQRLEWIDGYKQADLLLTYSRFGKETLEKESGGKLKVFDIGRPGVDSNVFVPLDKVKIKQKYGISPNSMVIGTVMRNQKRKLFPDLIDMFTGYINKCKLLKNDHLANNTYLLLHTSYPDVGYDIGRHIMQSGIGHKILCSYTCKNCGITYVDFFQTELSTCKQCKTAALHMPNSGSGATRKQLCEIYNLMDLYIQYSISEGFGMGIAEAKSCEIPAFAVDHSAMTEQVEVEGCQKIKVKRLFSESCMETEQLRALPDNYDCIEKIYNFFTTPKAQRERWGKLARKDVEWNHSFDRFAKVVENAIDILDCDPIEKTWLNSTANFAPLNLEMPKFETNKNIVNWGITNILGKKDLLNTVWASDLMKGLNVGYLTERGARKPCTPESVINMFIGMAQEHNFWEKARLNSFKFKSDMVKYDIY